jgi:ankyrin repeat protein
VTLIIGAASKTVVDRANAPAALTDLEQAIAATAGVERWTIGNGATIAALKAEGWDFHAATAANAGLLIAAAGAGNQPLVESLLQLGVSPDQRDAAGHLPLFAAIEGNHADVVRALMAAHADMGLKSSDGESAVDLATELGYDAIAQMLQPAHTP